MAEFIGPCGDPWTDDAKLYRLSSKVSCRYGPTDYVIVSSVDGLVCETLIFPSDQDGNVLSMVEISGLVGEVSHQKALLNMGYQLVEG
jgi:hypothetical protein